MQGQFVSSVQCTAASVLKSLTYECLPQNLKKAECEQFRSPSVSRGGVLEEVLHVQLDNALVWSSRLGVHNAELRGVVVVRECFTGVVHVVTQC
jgi:hypothetical protein